MSCGFCGIAMPWRKSKIINGNKFEQNDSYLQVSINKIENGNGEYDK